MPSVKGLVVWRLQIEGLNLVLYNQQSTTTLPNQYYHFMRHTQEPKRLHIVNILPECWIDFICVKCTGIQLSAQYLCPKAVYMDHTYNRCTVGYVKETTMHT